MDKEDRRGRIRDSIRNLTQYKNLSEEDFDQHYEKVLLKEYNETRNFDERVEGEINKLAEDYDLDDLKYNDKVQLYDLASAMVTLNDLRFLLHNESTKDISDNNINLIDKLNKIISTMRADISSIQDDLKLSRKIRKSDSEESVLAFIDKLKDYAKTKYTEISSYVFCPKCNMLVCTIWFLYPDQENKVTIRCGRTLDDGSICDTKFTISSKELIKNKGYSKKGIFPT